MRINYKLIFSLLSISLLIVSCSENSTGPEGGNNTPVKTNDYLVDTMATVETVALFNNLRNLTDSKVLFGHQETTAYGVGWWGQSNRSDVKDVCGDFPAVYGWDVGDINLPNNLDGVNFSHMKDLIRDAYARGGINTISMHLDNPVTNGNAWDNSQAVNAIIPGGSHHAKYLQTLDLIARFLKDLKTSDGTYIPIILRPYHEHNHSWPWWGKGSCTVNEYNTLWRMTVEHLRDTKGIHHLLYAISPQEISSQADYLERYPGDDYVDILGMDYYKLWTSNNIPDLTNALGIIGNLADSRGKISALTEIGVEGIPISDWWTNYLLKAITENSESKKTAWALVWRNADNQHHFAPYPDHSSAPDFQKFYNNTFTAFESDLPDMYR